MQKTLQARIINKHDTEENWAKVANTFIPKKGEIIIYDADSNYSYERIKVGDGTSTIGNLPFAINAEIQAHIDDIPTTDSTNLLTSGTIKTALDLKLNIVDAAGQKTAEGGEIFNDYENNAAGSYAHAEGYGAVASGNISHAEGRGTTASGAISHAEGYQTQATTQCAHAEGRETHATAYYAHAEGYLTTASGTNSHAEGHLSNAKETNSHAEGITTTASGAASHAEGISTTTLSQGAHAEGGTTIAGANGFTITNVVASTSSSVLTLDTTAIDDTWLNQKCVIKTNTEYCDVTITAVDSANKTVTVNKVIGNLSATTSTETNPQNYIVLLSKPSIGNFKIAYGAHAEGGLSNAYSFMSHAEGYQTKAVGQYSHAEGYQTFAGTGAHAEGLNTKALGPRSHAEGLNAIASGMASHAEGWNTTASGSSSHAEGFGTIASKNEQHVQGRCNIEDTANKYAHIVGNGITETARSNAHTLDWNGNAWYKGNIKVGGTSYDDVNAKKVLTDKDSVYEAFLKWGGKNMSADMSVISAASIDAFRANRLAFINKQYVDVEYSNDNGNSWTTLETTAAEINSLTATNNATKFTIGGPDIKRATTNDLLRITITARTTLYCKVRKLLVNVNTSGATGCYMRIEGAHCGSETEFAAIDHVDEQISIAGWTGWNELNVNDGYAFSFGGSDTQTSNYRKIRLTFGCTGVSDVHTSKLQILGLKMFAPQYWSMPNSLSRCDKMYDIDASGTTTFSIGNVKVNTGAKFIGDLEGTATKATRDASGNVITSTYATATALSTLDGEAVKKTGDQTIDGNKTFSKTVSVATPIEDNHATTKKYVDDGNILHEREGISLSISDKLYTNAIIDYKIYGNSVQDGTPSPDAPIEIQSVGNLVTDTASEHYGKYDVPVRVCGKNLLPNSDWMSGGHSNGFEEYVTHEYITEYTQNSISFNLDAWKGVSSPRFRKNSIKRIVFKINQDMIGSDSYLNFFITIQGYDDNNNKVGNQVIYNNTVADTEYVFDFSTISSYSFYANSTQFSFCILARKNALSNLMVYDIAYYADRDVTEYEPYVGETTHLYLDEPLRKIGDYADYIDWQNKKVVRNVFKLSLNATGIYKKLNSVIKVASNNGIVKQKKDPHMLSTIFNYNYDWLADTECIFHHNETNYNYYWSIYWNRLGLTYDGTNVYRTDDPKQTPLMDSEIISIANEWLSTLSDKDKEIYVILDTSIEETINIKNYETIDSDVTNISLLTSVEPNNIYLKYYKSLPTALENVASKNDIININNEIILTGGNAAGIIV